MVSSDLRGRDQTFSVPHRKSLQTAFPNVLGRATVHHRSTLAVLNLCWTGYIAIYIPALLNFVNIQGFEIFAHNGAERA